MSKFRVGDLVVFTMHDGDSSLAVVPIKVGRTYRVNTVAIRIRLEGMGGWWFNEKCFEFMEEENE